MLLNTIKITTKGWGDTKYMTTTLYNDAKINLTIERLSKRKKVYMLETFAQQINGLFLYDRDLRRERVKTFKKT